MLKEIYRENLNRPMTLLILIAICFIAYIFPRFVAAESLPPGSLDPSFGNGGIVVREIWSPAIGKGVAVQRDGKIVETGWYTGIFGMVRFNADGSLDSSFGNEGVALAIFDNGGSGSIETMAIQNDGRIIGAGWIWEGQKQVAAIARYNTNGSLDTSFNGRGTVVTASPLSAPAPNIFNFMGLDTAIQRDGKIVVVGESYYCAANDYFCDFGPIVDHLTVVRYNADGSRDTSFGNDGFIAETNDAYYSPKVAVQLDGKIVVTGEGSLIRYQSDGTRDITFGEGGIAAMTGTASDIVIQADSKIVISKYAYTDEGNAFDVIRFNGDGTPDQYFGNGGEVITPGGGAPNGSVSNSVAIQTDGRIVVAGTAGYPYENSSYAVRRYDPNGTLDHSYGTDGLVNVNVPGPYSEGLAVAIDAEGRAVVTGSGYGDSDWVLIRLNGGGSVPQTNVTVSGKVMTPDGRGLRNAAVSITNSQGVVRTVTTSSFGLYRFENVTTGETYTMAVQSRLYRFTTLQVQVDDTLKDVDFVGLE